MGVFGSPDLPPEGQVNVTNPRAFADPGPQDPVMESQLETYQPPDVGGMPLFWSSFNIVPMRVQNGGWARQVTTEEFPISTTIGVNMRLGPGRIRELHWHRGGMGDLAHTPSAMVQPTLNLSPETIAQFARTPQGNVG